jgi:hypothetical protein
MLDEEKIRLMARVTMYEKNEEFGSLVLARYYREDYVRLGCIRTVLVATVTYWLIVATYVIYRFEELLRDINNMDYFSVVGKLMLGYVGFCAIMYIFAFLIYHIRYQSAKKGLIEYNRNLKRLIKMADDEEYEEESDEPVPTTIRVSQSIGGDDPLLDEMIKGEGSKTE